MFVIGGAKSAAMYEVELTGLPLVREMLRRADREKGIQVETTLFDSG